MSRKIAFTILLVILLSAATGTTFTLFQDRYADPAVAANCYTLPMNSFDPQYWSTDCMKRIDYLRMNDTSVYSNDWFFAELNLPEGAEIRQVQVRCLDNSVFDMTIEVRRVWRDGNVATPLTFKTSGTQTGYYQMISPTRRIPVEHEKTSYAIAINLYATSNMGLEWVKVYYDMP